MSSWAVWAMVGLYPETPGTPVLVTTSPSFTSVVIDLGGGRHLELHAARQRAGAGYISKMTVNGRSWNRPWLPLDTATSGGTVGFTLVGSPARRWGSAADDAPPSYGS